MPYLHHKSARPERSSTPAEIRRTAIQLLTRREHTVLELQHKLAQRGFAAPDIDNVLAELISEDLINEERFAEVYAHSRADKGYGPLRISRELRERGVSEDIVTAVLSGFDDFWMPKLAALQRKRFGAELPRDIAGQAQQARFLRYRGFTLEQIKTVLRDS
ncbi:MAG: regulatory protein RecX [Candidatus Competibacteraceae bacterium]|nr:regulatory protein RecX [Candidatus Competibacteraceae bacterium]